MVNLSKVITAGVLAEELGMSKSGAAKLLKRVGGGEQVGDLWIYDVDHVKEYLRVQNIKLLAFLECAPTSDDHDW